MVDLKYVKYRYGSYNSAYLPTTTYTNSLATSHVALQRKKIIIDPYDYLSRFSNVDLLGRITLGGLKTASISNVRQLNDDTHASTSTKPIYLGGISTPYNTYGAISSDTDISRFWYISRDVDGISINKPSPIASYSDWINGERGYTLTFYFKPNFDGDSKNLALFSMSNASKRFSVELKKSSTGVFTPTIYSTNGSASFTGSGSIKKGYWYSFCASWRADTDVLYFNIADAPWSSASTATDKRLYASATKLSTMLGSTSFYHVGIGTPIPVGSLGTYLRGNTYATCNFIGCISPIQIEEGTLITNGCAYSTYQTHFDCKPIVINTLDTTTANDVLVSTTYAKDQYAYDEFIFQKPSDNKYYDVYVKGNGPGRWGRGYQGTANTVIPSWCSLNNTQPSDHTNSRQGYYYSGTNSNTTYTVGDGTNGYFCFKYYRSSSTNASTSSNVKYDYASVTITEETFSPTLSNTMIKYNNTDVNTLYFQGTKVNKAYFQNTLCYLGRNYIELANVDGSSSDAQSSSSSGFIDVTVTGSHGTTKQIIVPYGVKGPKLTVFYEDTVKCLTSTSSSSSVSTYTYTIKDDWRIVGRDTDGTRYSHGVKNYGK